VEHSRQTYGCLQLHGCVRVCAAAAQLKEAMLATVAVVPPWPALGLASQVMQPIYASQCFSMCQSMLCCAVLRLNLVLTPLSTTPPPPPPHTHTTPHPRPQLDAWVESHEAAEAARRAAAQAAMAEDGWTVVTRTKVTHLGHTGLYLLWLTQ
jgi:hypothetical protein